MDASSRPTLAVIGAGPAGLMAAEVAARAGAAVTLFDAMPSPARKFLLAGRGGLNLTHSEPLDRFLPRYGDAAAALEPAIAAFGPDALRAWSAALGEPTFVGSSGRVFPARFKTSPLLRAWLRRLASGGVAIRTRHRWTGWDTAGALTFATPDGPLAEQPAATLLALGGGSWPRLGSDGAWTAILRQAGAEVAPLRPSNCGFLADWSPAMGTRFAGHPLKTLAIRAGDRTARGEAVVTARGIEGGAVYALSAVLREAIARDGAATMHVDLRPDMPLAAIAEKLGRHTAKASHATVLRKALNLSPVAIALVQEARHRPAGEAPSLAALVKAVPVRLHAAAPLEDAISTAGGLAFAALDAAFMLRARPGVFAAGEMLDWEAPTGGYLLQACFATGAAAGRGAARWLGLPTAP